MEPITTTIVACKLIGAAAAKVAGAGKAAAVASKVGAASKGAATTAFGTGAHTTSVISHKVASHATGSISHALNGVSHVSHHVVKEAANNIASNTLSNPNDYWTKPY